MIRFNNHGHIPKSIQDAKAYTVVARNTLYGFHKTVSILNDVSYSKTNLLCFTERQYAESFYNHLQEIQVTTGSILERDAFGDTIVPFTQNKKTLLPLRIEELDLQDLKKLCLLHYFDMYVGFGMSYNIVENCYYIDCYEYETFEPPNRGIQISFLENMLRL